MQGTGDSSSAQQPLKVLLTQLFSLHLAQLLLFHFPPAVRAIRAAGA